MKKKRMIMKKGGVVEKRGEEETKSMPYAPAVLCTKWKSWKEFAQTGREKVCDKVKINKLE